LLFAIRFSLFAEGWTDFVCHPERSTSLFCSCGVEGPLSWRRTFASPVCHPERGLQSESRDLLFCRPRGTRFSRLAHPPLKRRAIIFRPAARDWPARYCKDRFNSRHSCRDPDNRLRPKTRAHSVLAHPWVEHAFRRAFRAAGL